MLINRYTVFLTLVTDFKLATISYFKNNKHPVFYTVIIKSRGTENHMPTVGAISAACEHIKM